MQKLTILDVIRGLLFFAVGLGACLIFMRLFGAVVFDNILNIKNPLHLILGATGFLVVYCIMVAFSKVIQAGYQKSLFSELFKQIRGK